MQLMHNVNMMGKNISHSPIEYYLTSESQCFINIYSCSFNIEKFLTWTNRSHAGNYPFGYSLR